MSEGASLPAPKEELKLMTNHPRELKEFEKLDLLLSQIPKKAQHGLLMSCDLVLTCIDASSLYIVLGTNVGIVFLYSRKDHSMQRLKSTSTNDVITSVRLHHGVDDQLAFATASGDVMVYLIPGVASLHKKQLQKFEVKDIHKHYVTCLEWSTNGMKLYSGDKNGLVVTTEVDFYEHQCKSTLLLVESSTEIIQLDYKHKLLVVSTRQRSFIVRLDQKCQLVVIGTKERKILGPFGACFLPGLCKPDDARLYAARPNCRLWLSDVNGVVINTYIFPDPLSTAVPEIPLLSAGRLLVGQPEFQFGVLKCFRGREIVTWSNSALVVLDPEANRVVARQGRLNGIVDVAVVDETEEIFLLRRHAEARVIRIAANKLESEIVTVTETLPMAVPEKQGQQDEKGKENPAQYFLRKLAKPLKNLERPFLHENKQEPRFPEPQKSSTIISPDLPPVVQLSSPDLDDVRLFTGGPQEPETSTLNMAACDAGTVTSPDPSSLMSSISPADTTATTTVVVNLPTPTISISSQSGLQDQAEVSRNAEEDSIVFTHKMRRHKRKRQKDGLLAPKIKDDDNISINSVSSQHSDDVTVTSVANRTLSTNDPILGTLQAADDILSLVNSLLVKSDGSQSSQPGLSHGVADTREPQPTTHKSQTSAVTSETKPHGPLVTGDNKPHVVVSTDDLSLKKSIDNGISSPLTSRKEITSQPRKKVDIQGSTVQPVPDSDSVQRLVGAKTCLSEGDQHLEMAKEMKPLTTDRQKPPQDASTIVEGALANLNKSKAMEDVKEAGEHFRISSPVITQASFQDIYSEIEAIESTDPFHKGYRKENSADDFYSLFLDTSPESPTSPMERPPAHVSQLPTLVPSEAERSSEMQDVSEQRLANTFTEFTTPANIYSLALSNSHVWFTDKSENIYYSSVGTPKGIQWKKATGYANQISVSPSGQIIWRLHRGVVYAGTKISSRHPEGLKWVEAVRDVAAISVDNDSAWFVMHNGDVMMQRRLSPERPCYKSQKVECPHRLRHIFVQCGIVWAITDKQGLLVRTGVSDEIPEGTNWELDNREVPPYLFSHVALDNENIGWAIDVLGQIWFCDGVTREQPLGRRYWWQVPMSEYILHDETTMDMIRGLARKFDPKQLTYILSTNRGGLISAGSHGVWLALNFRNILQVCQGNVQGYRWIEAQPAQMSPSSTWRQACAEVSHLDWGLVWAQHTNGDIFTFKHAGAYATIIPDCSDICCLAVGPTATWALKDAGAVLVRAEMGPHCPQGTRWVALDISQLGDAHLVHISCNSLYVWAVEVEGTVYQRIGARPPSETQLSPAWLPIDTVSATIFTRVHTGPLDWMVWAIDDCRLTYIRIGITENMPIGQEWVNVPGIQAMDLALTKTGVWALTPNGEIFFRYGITRDRPCGNYWKKIPGTFMKISASANDELWGINTEGQLMQCSVRYLNRHQGSSDIPQQSSVSASNSVSEDVDWEIV